MSMLRDTAGMAEDLLRLLAGMARTARSRVRGRIDARKTSSEDGGEDPRVPEPTKRYGVRCLRHNIPGRLEGDGVFGASITIENTGDFPWERYHPLGHRVDLVVRWNGIVAATHPLPAARVAPGETVPVCFPLHAPGVAGPHELSLELVEQNVARFCDRGVPPISLAVVTAPPPDPEKAALYEIGRTVNPWFYAPTAGIGKSADGRGFPRFAAKAKGCHLWDLEGRRYIDYIMAWGCTMLGYGDPRIREAVEAVLDLPPLLPFPHPLEMEVSRMLTEDFPCAEMVVFGKNGSDACTVAARLARVHTGRRVILYSGYHGWQDFWAEQAGFGQSGIPDRPETLIHRFRFNDLDDFHRLFQQHRHDLAAVMLEPSGPGESVQGPMQDADRDFLGSVTEAARSVGALLVYDEIITGYRYPGGSVQQATGVIPDLACLGKAVGSGMPISALAGRAEIFQRSMARTHYGPTFKGEIYSFAAAKAAIGIYRTEPVARHIWDYGARLKARINGLCGEIGIPAACKGPPFRMALIFDEPDEERLRRMRTLYIQELLKGGMTTYNGIMLPSYAHDDEVFDQSIAIIAKALEITAEAHRHNDFDRHIEIPLI